MILKLGRASVVRFLNENILAVNTKQVNLERVLTNLFVKMYANGAPVSLAYRKEYTIDKIKENLQSLENGGKVMGVNDNPEAVEDWLRSSILELINRGNVIKEHVATLKPLHLLSFRIQNAKYCRDYGGSDQLYLMLHTNQEVMQSLVRYLSKGWDKNTNDVVLQEDLDVDTLGILYLTIPLRERKGLNKEVKVIPQPFLKKQSDLFCDDIRRLLLYKDKLPRAVFIDYLRILCGFHLALYTMKVVTLLPKMLNAGTRDINDDWSMVVDVTDNLDSNISEYARRDVERMENRIGKYIRATYQIDIIQSNHECDVDEAIRCIHAHEYDEREFKWKYLDGIKRDLPDVSEKEFDKNDFDEMMELFSEEEYFNKVVHLLEQSNLGSSQARYLKAFLDSVAMKNTSSMLLADSRSRRHQRRGALGSKLLETLVQLLVIKEKPNGGYESSSLSIDELVSAIRKRYGLIINGVGEERFADADVALNAAFKENMDAFKYKLRQIGFYTDMSDACILQKIRPRYKIDD